MCRLLFTCILLVYGLFVFPSEGYMFRIQLKDKGVSPFSVDKPEQYLTQRAIDRRQKQNISIDSTDIPISTDYIRKLEDLGCVVVAKSRWMSTVSIYCTDSAMVNKISQLPFVDSASFVWKSKPSKKKSKSLFKKTKRLEKPQNEYGYAYNQIKMINGTFLHEGGYKGKGLEIAIIDAGYKNLNEILLLDNLSIKGYKDFVYQGEDMFRSSDHGLKVLSVMGANRPDIYVGTAPEAKYWLLRSEDGRSEYPVEEDYWVAAVEFADSVGVDVVNTSLGYSKFDAPAQSYTYDQLDGEHSYITRAAEIAVSKGIFMGVSAGNEGSYEWYHITVPADARGVLTTGAITRDSLLASFSSRGPSYDGRIKPDVVALGRNIPVVASNGEVEQVSGTSFSGPVMSGIAACLWEACPYLTNLQLLDVIRRSSSQYGTPNEFMGYGIPDMRKAMDIAREEYENKKSLD